MSTYAIRLNSSSSQEEVSWKQSIAMSTASTVAPSPKHPQVFTNDPSPSLRKRLLSMAHSRKRAGRHSLVRAQKNVLKLSGEEDSSNEKIQLPMIDRLGIPDDLFSALTAGASSAKKAGQHQLVRRRFGLSGEVESVLVLDNSSKIPNGSLYRHSSSTTSTASVYSPDPSMF